jgi:hypothetical protein
MLVNTYQITADAADVDINIDDSFLHCSEIAHTPGECDVTWEIIEHINHAYIRDGESQSDRANVLERIMGDELEGGGHYHTVPLMVAFYLDERNAMSFYEGENVNENETYIITQVFTEWYATAQNNGIM